MSFSITHKESSTSARTGKLETVHGKIKTPVFMPVGTRGCVKTISPRELEELNVEIILGNTYHLEIRPGREIIQAAGGLHSFIGWNKPILTDSGGYQVFSLSKLRKITPDGVEFRSHLDGSPMFLGPREAMKLQKCFGSDIAMVFDDCPPYPCTWDAAAESLDRTIRWASQSRENARSQGQLIFGIIQGSCYKDLREKSASILLEMNFDGLAIGGLSVGEPEQEMYHVLDWVIPGLTEEMPRYLMGVGTPLQIVEAVSRGIDMFDCVLPTRVGRNGCAYTRTGMKQIKGGKNKKDFGPIEDNCGCYACQNFSKAYIRHLLNVGEVLGLRLLSIHNLFFYQHLMAEIQRNIEQNTFGQFKENFKANYQVPNRKSKSTLT